MSVRYSETEYTYISAKVRSLEVSLVTKEQLRRMLASKNSEEAMALLRDNGFALSGKAGASECEDLLLTVLRNGFDNLKKGMPNPEVLDIFKLPYDCNNIKAAIKCGIRNIDCTPMLFETGTVPAQTAAEAVRAREFSVFPENLAKSAPEAIEEYNRTKNPQKIDFILDRACYRDIGSVAKSLKIPFINKLCATKADLTNFLICLRVLRMSCGAYGEKLIDEALVDGGVIDKKKFAGVYTKGEGELFGLIKKDYPYITDCSHKGDDLEKIERVCDDYRLSLAKDAKHTTVGIEIPTAYIMALENEIQNIRIILAGKDAGLDDLKIAERLRECYV